MFNALSLEMREGISRGANRNMTLENVLADFVRWLQLILKRFMKVLFVEKSGEGQSGHVTCNFIIICPPVIKVILI